MTSLGTLCVAAGLWAATTPATASKENPAGAWEIDSFALRNVPADAAFAHLAETIRAADPEGVGLNLLYRGPVGEAAPRLTVTLRRVAALEAVRLLAEAAGLTIRVEANVVRVNPPGDTTGPMITRFYPVLPSILEVVAGDDPETPGDGTAGNR